jgi:hypothetical protein
MHAMLKAFSATLAAAALVAVIPAAPGAAAGSAPATAATATPPPTIIHVVTRPLCAELHHAIAPAIGMILENDRTIQKSPALFARFNTAALYSPESSAGNAGSAGSTTGESADGSLNPAQNIALLGMENLVSPIANNIIAIQKLLDSPALTQGTGVAEDDQKLRDIRAKLLKAVATQSASLDIINGFVTTQQMGDLQHAGQEYISAANQPDLQEANLSTPTPNPWQGNQIGLPANPYSLDLANVPGLTLGYNPVTRLLEGLNWTISQTKSRENEAATTVMSNAALCGEAAPPSPKP